MKSLNGRSIELARIATKGAEITPQGWAWIEPNRWVSPTIVDEFISQGLIERRGERAVITDKGRSKLEARCMSETKATELGREIYLAIDEFENAQESDYHVSKKRQLAEFIAVNSFSTERDKAFEAMRDAARPLAHFIRQFDRNPIRTADAFYGIHTGTEWEAELRLSDLRALANALVLLEGMAPCQTK